MSYLELLRLVMPETIVVLTTVLVLAADALALREKAPPLRFSVGALISAAGCFVAIAWMLQSPAEADLFDGLLVVNRLSQMLKGALLLMAVCTIVLCLETGLSAHPAEYMALLLLGTVGMMFLVSTENILMIFLSLELSSLSLYLLAAFQKESRFSAEAALKYFMLGGVSAAFTLFGLSLLYGAAGETNLVKIAVALRGTGADPLILVALVMTLGGFAFKVAVAPFHLWAPDVYQGAPVPSAAFIASGSKVAGFYVLARVMVLGFKSAEGSAALSTWSPGWVSTLAVLAVASMLVGNLAAIVQTSVRRLLAYSAIAHAGYMLLAVMARDSDGLASLLYYVLTYALTTLGAFGVVAVVQQTRSGESMDDFVGLSRRAPVVSLCLLVFLLSLAGIPPLAGFFGKFYVFATALNSSGGGLGLLWLVALAIVMSVVSLYYYMRVLRQVFVAESMGVVAPLRVRRSTQALLVVLALGVVTLGCAPELLLSYLTLAVQALAR